MNTHQYNNTGQDDRIIRLAEVCKIFGVSETTIKSWVDDPELGFPAPRKIRARLYWRENQINAFLSRQQYNVEAETV